MIAIPVTTGSTSSNNIMSNKTPASEFLLTNIQRQNLESWHGLYESIAGHRDALESLQEYKNLGLEIPHRVLRNILTPDELRSVKSELLSSYIRLTPNQLIRARLLIMVSVSLDYSDFTVVQNDWNTRWNPIPDLEHHHQVLIQEFLEGEIDVPNLASLWVDLPWYLMDEIEQNEIQSVVLPEIPVPCTKVPEVIYLGDDKHLVHMPKASFQKKQEEKPDAYVWLIIMVRQGFRGISSQDFQVLLIRTYGQFHGIPKHGFNTALKRPLVALGELITELSLERILERQKRTEFQYTSTPFDGQTKQNFCFVYEFPNAFEINRLPEIKHHDPVDPKYDQRTWLDSKPIFDRKLKCKFRLNKQTGETLKEVLKHQGSIQIEVPVIKKHVVQVKPVPASSSRKVVRSRFALADDSD